MAGGPDLLGNDTLLLPRSASGCRMGYGLFLDLYYSNKNIYNEQRNMRSEMFTDLEMIQRFLTTIKEGNLDKQQTWLVF